jgi:type I restriction enzyme S subunit
VVRLGDVATINPRVATALEDDSMISFLGMADVSAMGSTSSGHSRPYREVKKGFTPFFNGDLLVAKITPCFENGKIAQASLAQEHGFGSTEFHVVRTNPDMLDSRYALHMLRLPTVKLAGERRMTGSAGQKRVPKDFLENLEIHLPPLPEQRRIASILDQADALRTRRTEALQTIGSCLASEFDARFGRASGWRTVTVADMLSSADYGTSAKAGEVGEFPVLRMGNLTVRGDLDLTSLKYMDLTESEQSRYLLSRGDVLFNRTNSVELVGKTAIYRSSEPMAFAGYLVRLRVSPANDPEYLAGFLNSPAGKRELRKRAKSAIGMANINAKEVQQIPVPLPPLDAQREYASLVASVTAAQTAHRTHLTLLDELFASLQHRAFRG